MENLDRIDLGMIVKGESSPEDLGLEPPQIQMFDRQAKAEAQFTE